jgi:7-carboxy-7-deazaguanine synthase (Cx14CxxC type)
MRWRCWIRGSARPWTKSSSFWRSPAKRHREAADRPGGTPVRSYAVKEIFLTLQGEGAQAGRAAVFCRFTGCNLWSGLEADRATAVCRFCDTDFVGMGGTGGGRFADAASLADAILAEWRGGAEHRLVVLTGGEPLLQVDSALTAALHARGFSIAVETNGTQARPPGLDWVCVSPKAGAPLAVLAGDELKLVYPQPGAAPGLFAALDFRHFLLQPMDGPDVAANTAAAIEYCLAHPQWRLSVQTHKVVGLR